MPKWVIHQDLKRLAALDADIGSALAIVGEPPPRRCEAGFVGLARMIVFQQVSAASGTAIWKRFEASCGVVAPEAVRAKSEPELRSAGLSRQKSLYLHELAGAILDGRVDLERVHGAKDDVAIAELVQVKGIGTWSAENYLLFALERRDVFPAGDLALKLAFQHLKRKRQAPTIPKLRALSDAWSPYRSAAAHFLWHYYAHQKSLAKAPPRSSRRRRAESDG